MDRTYPIGTPGQPWGDEEKRAWLHAQALRRSYRDDVVSKLESLDGFEVFQYGALSVDPARYPLMAVRVASARTDAPWALITGGVHGYETSGVQGALAFLETEASVYRERVNLLVVPCVSPWGYEAIQRWNPSAVDPNRSFSAGNQSEEATSLMALLKELGTRFLLHVDLHETTNTDETEFRPAVAARDGLALEAGSIPDGFYTVGDTDNPQPEFQAAIIAGVEQVTHIAAADDADQLLGSESTQRGVILYPFTKLGLCAGATGARYTTTTEVYPDSPRATPEICIAAQVAALRAALEFALRYDVSA